MSSVMVEQDLLIFYNECFMNYWSWHQWVVLKVRLIGWNANVVHRIDVSVVLRLVFFMTVFLLWWQFVRRRNNNVNFSEIRPRSLCCAGCIHEEISLARRFSLAMWREGGSIVTRDFCDQEEKERRNSEWELNWCRYLKCIQKPIPSKYPEIQAKDFQSSQGHD